MTSIFTLTHPLFSVTEALLTRIRHICAQQNIAFFIAGATAREIMLHHVHGRNMGRRTRDIDIAIFVDGWPKFTALKQAFLAAGAQTRKDNLHRLVADGVELDIIPFGIIAENRQIAWPPDRTIIMAVDGFEEAFAHSVTVELDNGERLPFCSLPGLALLKLFAWRDRGEQNAKDAADLYKIISEYGEIENERIYDVPGAGEQLEWNTLRMGALLLGQDMAQLSQPSSLKALASVDTGRLTDAVARQLAPGEAEHAEQLMIDFWHGVQLASDKAP